MEWNIVLVISTLLGILVIVAKPVIGLTQAISTLTSIVEGLKKDFEVLNEKNTESHRRLWAHNDEQDEKLVNHDKRISRLEDRNELESKV